MSKESDRIERELAIKEENDKKSHRDIFMGIDYADETV